MKFEIDAMRRQPNLAGDVITEFTDAYWESNGLLDFYRNTKVYHDEFATINTPDVIRVPQLDRYAVWSDQALTIRLHLAHYSAADWAGARLRWRVGEAAGEHPAPALPRGGVAELGRARWRLPAGEAARTATIELELAGEHTLATNRVEVLVLPAEARRARYAGKVAVVGRGSAGPDLAELVSVDADPAQAQATPTSAADGDAKPADLDARERAGLQHQPEAGGRHRAGGDDLADRRAAELGARRRRYAVYSGQQPVLLGARPRRHLQRQLDVELQLAAARRAQPAWAVSSPLGLPFMRVMPRQTILGIPAEDPTVQPDLLAGMVSGGLATQCVTLRSSAMGAAGW